MSENNINPLQTAVNDLPSIAPTSEAPANTSDDNVTLLQTTSDLTIVESTFDQPELVVTSPSFTFMDTVLATNEGDGVDAADDSSIEGATGQMDGVRVNLDTGVQDEIVQHQGFVNGEPVLLAQGVKLADLDVEGMSFVMQGGSIYRNPNLSLKGQAILVNRDVQGQVTLWAATATGLHTKAVQLKLVDTEEGVTVQTLQAKYTNGNVLDGSFNFDVAGSRMAVATASGRGGYGVSGIDGRVLGDTLADIENMVGTQYNGTLIGDLDRNVLAGGAGNDTLEGGLGADAYAVGRGTGQDLVTEIANSAARNAITENNINSLGVAVDDSPSIASNNEAPANTLHDNVTLLQTTTSDLTIVESTFDQPELVATSPSFTFVDVAQDIDDCEVLDPTVDSPEISDPSFADYFPGLVGGTYVLTDGAGNDLYVSGLGPDNLDGGEGVDTVDYSSFQGITGQTEGVLVNLETGMQEGDVVQRKGFVLETPSLLAEGVTVADLDVEGMSFVLLGQWINWNRPLPGQAILVNRDKPGEISLWAATIQGPVTKAVQLRLVDAELGVTVQTLQAKYTDGNVLDGSFDFNEAGDFAPLGEEGYGVSSITSRVLGDTLTDIENVMGSRYDDTLIGDAGNNVLISDAGDDTLTGGLGRDTLDGGEGMDTADYSSVEGATGQTDGVRVNLETGVQDEVVQHQGFVNGDPVLLAQGVKLADLDIEGMSFVMQGASIYRNPNLSLKGQAILVNRDVPGQITLWAATIGGPYTKAVQLKLMDTDQGVTVQTLQAKYTNGNVLDGSFNFDVAGSRQAVAMKAGGLGYGVSGIDGRVLGDTLADIENVVGTQYNDTLIGDLGSNVLTGGAGNDTLVGGLGADTYTFGRGAGQDLVTEIEDSSDIVDVAMWGSEIRSDQLWFTRTGNDLHISVIGEEDQVTVQDWYLGNDHQVERFVAGDGKTLLNTQVDALVSSMAQFDPPPAGQTTLADTYQANLAPILAANWQ